MGLLQTLFPKKDLPEKRAAGESGKKPRREGLMLSQYPALFLSEQDSSYRDEYVLLLKRAGVPGTDALRLFAFECDVLRNHPKPYLLDAGFARAWFFGLRQPFFLRYPKEQEDILNERFLMLSEICKLIDEAEWHFWNSHERELSDEVWGEIYAWRLGGQGGQFAARYFEMAAAVSGAAEQSVWQFSDREGTFLKYNKWRA